jgi:hypothetical protein
VARVHALRQAGVPLREHPDEHPTASLLTSSKTRCTQVMAQHGLTDWQFGFNTNKRREGVLGCLSRDNRRPLGAVVRVSTHAPLGQPEPKADSAAAADSLRGQEPSERLHPR